MQVGFPLQAARQALRLSTTGSAMGDGEPAGTALTGLAWVPTRVATGAGVPAGLTPPRRASPPGLDVVGTTDGIDLQAMSYATRLV
jgi:hypothetical protein